MTEDETVEPYTRMVMRYWSWKDYHTFLSLPFDHLCYMSSVSACVLR